MNSFQERLGIELAHAESQGVTAADVDVAHHDAHQHALRPLETRGKAGEAFGRKRVNVRRQRGALEKGPDRNGSRQPPEGFAVEGHLHEELGVRRDRGRESEHTGKGVRLVTDVETCFAEHLNLVLVCTLRSRDQVGCDVPAGIETNLLKICENFGTIVDL